MTELDIGRAVDWGFAATVGSWLARPAPPMTDYTREQVIGDLHRSAAAAEPLVREVTGLGVGGPVPEARVLDRPQWIAAAAESMRLMTGGTEKSAGFISGRLAGAQTGALLAFVSSGILGQYDPFCAEGGALLLVYPNVIAIERQLRVTPADFRLWVCLHEVTHRVQFSVNPWLPGYMSDALAVLTGDASPDVLEVVGRLTDYLRGRRDDAGPSGILGLVRAVQSEEQRAALDQLLTLGTLLEGHADHVMDAVGPAAVPSVATIRSRFEERRQRSQPPLQRLLRALMGLDAKLSQYTRGKAFVDAVVGRVGMDRFNAVWSGPQALPLPAEIEEPQRWIDRVL
ncbi:hydrolase [Mycolicibacter terrae]|uniref:Hydrolase n=1 Tax=Mycolicibacter terrae TaxID=1788 RepID=A0ACD2EIG9_9MYCO|nr:zinc-dependent metalloprotease [Mycolicibacter terrae]RRR41254.1 hydrolase [Mycolicibacter terrae]